MTIDGKEIPAPIVLAHQALAALTQEDAALAESVKNVLPAYALRQEKAGAALTPESLLAAARKGAIWLRTQDAQPAARDTRTPLEIYQDIVGKFPELPPSFGDLCAAGDLERVKALHENYAFDDTYDIHTAALPATRNGHLHILQYLHKNGVDMTVQHNLSIAAAENGHLHVLQYLHENGADMTVRDNLPIIVAAGNGHLHILKYLHENGADMTTQNNRSVIIAANNGHLHVLQYLHKHGADMAAQDNQPVIVAAQNGRLHVLKYLRKHGADINTQAHLAVIRAAEYGDLPMLQYLHKHGADMAAQDNEPVIVAAANGHLHILNYLHENGADMTARDNRSVIIAAENGHLHVLQYLHKHGADMTAQSHLAVIRAAEYGDLPMLQYLHRHGADMTAPNKETVIIAALRGHLHVLQYMHEHGANISALNPDQRTVYDDYRRGMACWEKLLRRQPPQGLHKCDPAFFRQGAYEFILPLLAAEYYTDELGHQMAFDAAALFQTPARVVQYLKAWGQQGKQPLHDVVHMIALPKTRGAMNIKDWGDAVLKLGPNMAKLAKFADRLPSPVHSADGKSWSYQATRTLCAQFSYERAAEHPALAALCFENGVGEDDFNKALKIVLKAAPPQKNLPDIVIDGKKFDMPGGKFYRLAEGDVRGLFLGELTDCCQSIGGHGSECARYGYISENGGFYVVENAKGRVVSQTFAWRAQGGGLCFDTLETLGDNVTATQWAKILKEMSAALTQQKNHDVSQLSIGMGGGTPLSLTSVFETAVRAVPLDYNGYSEAKEQALVWQRFSPS